MKRSAVGAGMLLLMWTACAAELPEIVARCGTRTVSREEAAGLMNAAPAEYAALPRREMLKKVLTDRFCAEAMTRMLTDAGFPPTAEQAEQALSEFFRHYPAGMKRPDPGDLHRIAQEEKTRLQWAYFRYLSARKPDVFLVPPQTVERYYRENQTDFLLPRRTAATRYTAADTAVLTTLSARVRQGESPEKVLQTLSGVRSVPVAEDDPATAKLHAGDWSAVVPVPGGGYAVTHVSAEFPAGYVPLEQAAPLIRDLLGQRRAAWELERSLEKMLAEEKMEFYF